MKIEEAFGKLLKDLREERNLSQEKLAEKSDLHRNTIALVETAKRQPSLKTIFAIAKALNLSPSELISKLEKKLGRKR
jgi:transcriptional regulator with XRE-family HTH domain